MQKTEAGINETAQFYRGESPSLFYEMTVCQSLADLDSPALAALTERKVYGQLLAEFLQTHASLPKNPKILEVGGGYGTLMRSLARVLKPKEAAMFDISPAFLEKQQAALAGFTGFSFHLGDALEGLPATEGGWDLLLGNENLGDFPTITGLTHAELKSAANPSPLLQRARRLIETYRLPVPEEGSFCLNAGALELVEKIAGRVKTAFFSEHSATVVHKPPYDFLKALADGTPRQIPLKDHSEYSIDFNHLELVALAHGFKVLRVPLVEILKVRCDEGARFMAGAECVGMERAEMIHEFMNHVKEYECALLTSS